MEDYFIESITKIANHEKVIEKLEPNVAFHLPLEDWMTRRVLYALGLLKEESKRRSTK